MAGIAFDALIYFLQLVIFDMLSAATEHEAPKLCSWRLPVITGKEVSVPYRLLLACSDFVRFTCPLNTVFMFY